MSMDTILIIDDEPTLAQALADYLEDFDYETSIAGNGQEGLNYLQQHDASAVIVDLNMPVMDGYSFIERTTADHPNLPIIALSGVGLVEEAIRAVKLGAWDFISKPVVDMEIVTQALDRNMDKARLVIENEAYQKHLEELVHQRTAELEQSRKQIVHCLAKAAEFKDNETGMHVIRVGEVCYLLAKALGLDEKHCRTIREAAPMHDIGKIGIRDDVLLKPGKFEKDEWEHMKKHVQFGCEILTAHGVEKNSCGTIDVSFTSDLLGIARIIALTHHEKWDGSGYPLGLKENEIPIEGRIVALADVYDALASERPYKKAFSQEKCLEIIQEGRGIHFDPKVVDAFMKELNAIQHIQETYKD